MRNFSLNSNKHGFCWVSCHTQSMNWCRHRHPRSAQLPRSSAVCERSSPAGKWVRVASPDGSCLRGRSEWRICALSRRENARRKGRLSRNSTGRRRSGLSTEAEPLFFDEDLKSDGGAEVGIQEYLGQRGELSRPVPAIGAMQSHRAAFLLHQPRDLRGRDLVLARRRRRGGHTGRNRPDSQDSIL